MVESSDHEDLLLRYTRMVGAYDTDPCCYLVALDAFDIGLIQSALRYAHWLARWRDLGETSFTQINERINRLEECLMSGCDVSQLIEVLSAGFDNISEGLTSLASQLTVWQPGCTSGGTETDAPNGEENGTPPPGYTEADPGTTNRKCRVANFIIDSIKEVAQTLQVLDVEQWVGVGFVLACSLIGATIGSAVPVAGTILGAVAGVVVNIAVMLIVDGVAASLDDLITILDSHRDDLVCALYTAGTAEEARVAVGDRLATFGATWVERLLVRTCLPNRLTNLLFFTIPIYEGIISSWGCTTDCALCSVEDELIIAHITPEDAGIIVQDGNVWTITSEWLEGFHRANFQCCMALNHSDIRCADFTDCSHNIQFTWPLPDNWIRKCNDWSGFLPKPFECADILCFKQLALSSQSPFVIQFTLIGECEP